MENPNISYCDILKCLLSYFCDLKFIGLVLAWLAVIGFCQYVFQSATATYICAVLYAIGFFLRVCWLSGINENRPGFLIANVVNSAFGIIILYICVIWLFFVLKAKDEQKCEANIFLLVCLIYSVIMTYIWTLIYSKYKKSRDTLGSTGHEESSA
ncbi:uncharacterized protein LOC116344393 [Contarinia nasturtii]|uniref:uncharacterized protein LOC116344393 n=1 Tax=Contarinia nasturtii TaxID=265458 RepID=UPI0012D44F40|nr:uncharacterized protein LOC116344393 [Contarinia nasturtii]